MTRDEVLAMKPGRELDALVWLMLNDKPLDDLLRCRYVDGDVQPHAGYPAGHISPPPYSTNIKYAAEVALKYSVGLLPKNWAEVICKSALLLVTGWGVDD